MDYPVTARLEYAWGDGVLMHEIHDGTTEFRHRLSYRGKPADVEGEWVGYVGFARINIKCPACDKDHIFMATQDSWQPMFPPIFELRIPDRGDVPPHQVEVFRQFKQMGRQE